ncbi:hypothetical protein BZA77DRAFT_386417 [Pyronema omphalodes]|nr:hypothetical protein BZA77DRAFT_386417 [Pyronema omphalodes]
MMDGRRSDNMAFNAHTALRVLQILTLVPAWALMAAVLSWFQSSTHPTPASIVILFLILLLSSIWSFCILIAVLRAHNTALWITFWDILIVGGLIAGISITSNLANYECGAVIRTYYYTVDGRRLSDPGFLISDQPQQQFWDKAGNCALLKAAWGLALVNVLLFFGTALLAWLVYRRNQQVVLLVSPPSEIKEEVFVEYPDRPRRMHRSSRASRSDRRRGEGIYGERYEEY